MIRADFPSRILDWCIKCFGAEIAMNKSIRNFRFLEEALELVQSLGLRKEQAHQLVEYVFSRPVGVPHQEMGGTVVTLYALANANDLDVATAGWEELERINMPQVVEKIRAKQKKKPHPDDVLPVGGEDDQKVNEFTAAIRDKMALVRAKGRGDWKEHSASDLQDALTEHVRKGDPVDVAIFCMMLWHMGAKTNIVYGSSLPALSVTPPKPLPPGAVMKDGVAYLPVPDGSPLPDGFYTIQLGLSYTYPDETSYHMDSSSGDVAVADALYYSPMSTCPRGVAVLLLGAHGVATLAQWDGRDSQWRGWFPLPRVRK